MKTLNIFYLVIYWTQKVHNDFIFLHSLHCIPSVPELRKCMDTSRKSLLAESAATHAQPAAPLCQTWKTCLPSPLWAVQRHESYWRRGLASMADVEDTRRTDLGLLQQLNRQYGAKHCHVATKHLYPEVRVIWTWLQDADDSLGNLHVLHCSQCYPWTCSAPRLSLVHPKRVSITFPGVPDQVKESLLQN
jgi:hypothetical protein